VVRLVGPLIYIVRNTEGFAVASFVRDWIINSLQIGKVGEEAIVERSSHIIALVRTPPILPHLVSEASYTLAIPRPH
jgi:hypothetical protein